MRSIRRSGVTALTAAIALSLGAIPVGLTVPSILAGEETTTVTPADFVSAGTLELSTALSITASATLVSGGEPASTQTYTASNCTPVTLAGSDLLTIAGKGKDNRGNVVTRPVGLLKGGFGVQDKGTGTSCGQVDSAAIESLTLALGSDVVGTLGLPVRASSARLDLDLKGGARVTATATGPAGTFTRILQSGTPLAGDVNNPDVTPCSQGTDSGPDSGANDNCDWDIVAPTADEYFTSLTLVATTGSFALSGGADYSTNPGLHRSLFELVEEIDGDLCIGDEYPLEGSEDGTTPAVIVTRLGNADNTTGECVPYRFTNGLQNAELLKPIDQEESAQFHFEFTWTVPADTTSGDDSLADGLVRRTSVDFDGDLTLDDETVIAACPDLTPATFTRTNSEGALEEFEAMVVDAVLDNDNAPDLAESYPGSGSADTKQFACIVSQQIDLIPNTDDALVRELIYAYGDIRLLK